jgi:hypothetical protein
MAGPWMTSTTRAGGKRRVLMACNALGLVSAQALREGNVRSESLGRRADHDHARPAVKGLR